MTAAAASREHKLHRVVFKSSTEVKNERISAKRVRKVRPHKLS